MMRFVRVLCAILVVGLVSCKKEVSEVIDSTASTPSTTPDITYVASLGTPEFNEIWYTSTDGRIPCSIKESAFNTQIEHIENFEDQMCVIRFKDALTAIGDNAFNGCYNIANISLPKSVTYIGNRAFHNCTNMECITLGGELHYCGEWAFSGCFNLMAVHTPDIQSWCNITFENPESNPSYYTCQLFVNDSKVTKLVIPDGVEHINSYAFYNNTALTNVDIPASVKSIGEYAFYGCDYITSVSTGDVSKWCEIEFADELSNPLSIAKVLYSQGSEVRDVYLESAQHMGSYTFINCTTIRAFTAGNALLSIGTDTFRNCSSLTSVSLGNGIRGIGKHAFMNCGNLVSVTCYAPQPPHLADEYVFEINNVNRTFYLPNSAIEGYRADEMWSKYAGSFVGIN